MALQFTNGYALLVGVGADLPSTAADAEGLARILTDPERSGYPVSQVQLLTHQAATREAILEGLDRLAQSTDANSTVIVFLSGYGFQVMSDEGPMTFLLPYGYDVQRLAETAISGQEFSDRLRAIPAPKVLILLDCCHAGGLLDAKASGLKLTKSPVPLEAASLLAERGGRVLIASSQEDEVAHTGDPYSVFTLAVMEVLSGIGVAKKDGYVRVTDVAFHVREVVPQRTQGRQHPVLHFEDADDFVLAYYAGGKLESSGLPFTARPEIQPEVAPTVARSREDAVEDLQQRFEEVRLGISFGGASMPADAPHGTITALVTDRKTNQLLLLLPGGILSPGTEVIQPSSAHGGDSQDKIGVVEREVFSETCIAAVARLELEGERDFLSILPNGQSVAGVGEPRVGLEVCKFGGGSGYTQSQIVQTDADIELTDDYQRKIVLRDAMFIVGPGFSQPGDVGALVLTADTRRQAVGVIVGHIEDQVTVCLPIQSVLDELGVDLVTRTVRYRSAQQATDRIAATTDLVGGEDRLGFTHYVEAFVRLIEDTEPPLTIGIYGGWGTGKSFLMDKIAKRLKPKGDVKQVEKLTLWQKMFRLAKTQTPVVWFDAWDYNACDKLWAGLVERIFLSIENSGLGWYGQLRINLKRNLERQWRALRAKLLPYTLIAIVAAALTLGFVLTNQDAWATAVGGSTAFVLLASLVRQLAGVFRTSASQRIVDLFATPDYKADIGFMGRIRQDLEDFANSLPEGMKVVVFIDDLDRCDPKKAVEVLEAIKLLLDFKRFIVFLALDARVITQAIEEHYGKVLTEAEITGYEYLDKIVQIPFSIPEPPPSELRKYIGSLVGLSEADIPPIETMAVRQEETKEERQPPEFVKEPMTPGPTVPEQIPMPPSPVTGAPPVGQAEQVPSTTQPPAAVSPLGPSDGDQVIEDMLYTSVVTFTRPEQQAILAFYSHLDSNPRRIKRVINIYRLVRALIASQRQAQEAGKAPVALALPEDPHHILGWLVMCEQWPYAAHVMLEILDCTLKQEVGLAKRRELLEISVEELWQTAKKQIDREKDETLKKLDLTYDRLQSFVERHLAKLALGDVQQLRPFTVNFNPALSAEVRLTLSSGERGPVQPVEAGAPVSVQ